MTQSFKTESISQDLLAPSDGKSNGTRIPPTLPSTSSKSKIPNVLGSWSSFKNGSSFGCSLKSQDSVSGAVHSEGENQESMKSSLKHESWKFAMTQPTLVERPLHRETESEAEIAFEEPLKRPVDVNVPKAFRDMNAVIAVDVSGSTRGKVIEQEIKAAQTICNNFSEVAVAQTIIIPWDHRLHTFTTAKDTRRLKSRGGGTRPSALTSSNISVDALGKCSAWLLFTDGEIIDREIRDFSRGLCTNGLHGTACIIVLFGYKCDKPVDCNISVGISIFGMAPDCLFLFHDIASGTVSILQSKGVFNKLLPSGSGLLSLDEHTKWWDLPTISYSDLLQINIPAPRKLDPGDILLQSNLTVRLKDIYNDTVDAATASELLEDDDNLKTLLLTSEISGESNKVKNWIANQKMKAQDMMHIPRPDVNSEASTYIRELLLLGVRTKDLNQKRSLQTKLRFAHKQNWVAFISDTDSERTKVLRREEVIHNALDRVASNAVESSRGSWSTRMIAPILPGGPKKSFVGLSTFSTTPSKSPMNPLPGQFQHDLSRPADSSSNCGNSPAYLSPETDVLFIPGYKYKRGSNSTAFEGECPLCGDIKAILALLVKEPARGVVSPGFPEPNSRALLEFPLTIGAYLEAEVLSSFVCCDSCAYHLVKMRKSPYGENVVGAIPLIAEALSGNFQHTTLETLDNALSKRFEKSALEQVFLSILYHTLMSIKDDSEDIEKRALHWAASLLSTLISVSSTPSATFNMGQLSVQGNMQLRQVLSNSLDALSKPSPTLLRYPLGGFIVMIQCMIDLRLDLSTVLLKNAVFQRILYHIVEKYHECLIANGREVTIKSFRSLTWSPESQSEAVDSLGTPLSDDTFDILSVPRLSVPISTLTGINLFFVKDGEILQKLGPLFIHVNDKCSCAIAVFLHILCREAWADSKPMEIFDRIRAQEAFCSVFEVPQRIGEAEAKELIGLICFGTVGAVKSEMLPRSLDAGGASGGSVVESLDFDMLSEESYGGA
jgi:hypothetical protein